MWTDSMHIFGGVEPQTESTSLFLYIIIFQRWESFEPPSSTPREDKQMHSRTFCVKFNFEQLLFKTFFWRDAYFWRRRALFPSFWSHLPRQLT